MRVLRDESASIEPGREGQERHQGIGLEPGSNLRTGRSHAPAIVLAALAALALIVNAGLTVSNVRRVRDAEEWVVHTHRVLDTLGALLSSAVDAETGQRGFLITGRATYLQPYKTGRTAVQQRLSRLQELTRDDLSQQERIDAIRLLVAAKLEELQRVIDVFQAAGGGFEAARAVVLDDDGKRLMDAIRARVAEMEATENSLLEVRAQAATTATRTAVVTSLVGLAANLALLAGAFAAGRSRLRERERAAALLHAEKERLGTTLTSIGDAVVVTDPEGRITMMNPVARSLLGWGDDALGRPLDEVFCIVNEETHGAVESPVRRVLRENKVVGLANHTVLIRRDGSEVPIDDSGAPIRAADGTVIGVVLVFRSIEQRRKAEHELQRRDEILQEQDRHKDAFLATLSHELRNPLAAMRNAVALLQRAEPGTTRFTRAENIIDRQVTHVARLVDDLLDVSRITQGKIRLKKERIDLAEIVRQTVEDHRHLFARGKVELEFRPGGEPLWVNADRTRMSQVAGNILQNAAKFTTAGDRVWVSVAKEDGRALFRVRDTGAGFDAATLANLFQPFFQSQTTLHRSAGGLGLGLALSKALVDLHDGAVNATSEGRGKGAEFSVWLPLAASAALDVASEANRPSRHRLSILVIEDSEDAASSLRDLLELEGHDVRVAEDGIHGVDVALAVRPDVVVCDLGLPGIDGYEVAKQLRAAGLPAVLLALTGYASSDDVLRGQEAGFRYHLVKPIEPKNLLDILARL